MFASKAFIVAVFCIAATMAACPAPRRFDITGCTSKSCILFYDEEIEAQVDFTVVNNTENLKLRLKVIGVKENIFLSYDLVEENPCDSLIKGECPLTIGQEVTYQLKMSIPNKGWTDGRQITLDFDLMDDKDNSQVCFMYYDAELWQRRPKAI